jgi:hypothetical protein
MLKINWTIVVDCVLAFVCGAVALALWKTSVPWGMVACGIGAIVTLISAIETQ